MISKSDFRNKIERLAVNYQSIKAVLAALESLLVLLGKYRPSYSERASLTGEVAEVFFQHLSEPHEAAMLFTQAFQFKLNPQGLEELSPVDCWFKATGLLNDCLKIYHSQGYTDSCFDTVRTSRIKEFASFSIQGRFEPRALLISSLEQTAIRLMLRCLFSIEPEDFKKPLKKAGRLLSDCRYANYLHTRGEWCEITDHIKVVRPMKVPH